MVTALLCSNLSALDSTHTSLLHHLPPIWSNHRYATCAADQVASIRSPDPRAQQQSLLLPSSHPPAQVLRGHCRPTWLCSSVTTLLPLTSTHAHQRHGIYIYKGNRSDGSLHYVTHIRTVTCPHFAASPLPTAASSYLCFGCSSSWFANILQ